MAVMKPLRCCGNSITLLVLLASAARAENQPVISAATREAGILVHAVESPYQQGTTKLRVLLPDDPRHDKLRPGEKLPVVYVLPVEAKDEARYGDGLDEVKRHDFHNKQRTIFVAPTFSRLPWYADHPTDKSIRQESHLMKVVVPFIEQTYPARAEAEGRLLLGFSKSGWGAWCLLLRHPDIFGRAAAWDAPLMMDQPGKYGSGPIFGTPENFAAYRISDLLPAQAESLASARRLILIGYGNFRSDHQQAHALLDKLGVPHEYRDGPQRKHDWHSGWLPEAVELLVAPRGA
jgi:S-formylglutathione hydrolase FrmB